MPCTKQATESNAIYERVCVRLVNKVAIIPGNKTDVQDLEHVCPTQGGIDADKGYCTNPAKRAVAKRAYHLAAAK